MPELQAPEALPPKLKLSDHIDKSKGETFEDLPEAERLIYDKYWAKHNQRQDPSQEGVAQEYLDCVAWLKSKKRSPMEADNIFGYSRAQVGKPAEREEKRIQNDLRRMPSKDVKANPAVALRVSDVKGKIPDFKEFVPKDPKPEPVVEG